MKSMTERAKKYADGRTLEYDSENVRNALFDGYFCEYLEIAREQERIDKEEMKDNYRKGWDDCLNKVCERLGILLQSGCHPTAGNGLIEQLKNDVKP